ncbi:MAG: LysM peptidoglycan-binding domain-containing protein [Anaerolineaceae bacterium]|nr:LysM peptidoglycan-binding domain-containing protein [Anaerolineaceae bacterium]
MKNIIQHKFFLPASAGLIVTTLIILVFIVFQNRSEDQLTSSGTLTAMLNEIQGTVHTFKKNQSTPELAYNGQEILEGDQVLTEADGMARLDFSSGSIVRVGPQSIFTIQKLVIKDDGPFTQLKMEIGELWVILKGGALEVNTPSGVAAVRGSYMHVHIIKETGEVIFTCLEGICKVGNTFGSVDLVAGQMAVISNYSSPPKPGRMDPTDVNRWLINNPEATLVVLPLTATVGALPEEPPSVNPPDPDWCPDTTDWTSINVRPGDTFANLAKEHGILPSELAHANCLEISSALEPGTTIYLPPFLLSATPSPTAQLMATTTNTATITPTRVINTPTPTTTRPVIHPPSPTYELTATKCTKPEDWVLYIVKAGDTLYDIALPRGITSAELQSGNCLDSSMIFIDQQLYAPRIIPTPTSTITSTHTITVTITVTATATETLTPTITSTATQ